MSFTGGKLKLKGGVARPPKPGSKKRKQKKVALLLEDKEAEAHEAASAAGMDGAADDGRASTSGAPEPPVDRRTPAERKLDEHRKKYEEKRVALAASKSHRERIAEMNEKLANLTEHHDIFRISYTA